MSPRKGESMQEFRARRAAADAARRSTPEGVLLNRAGAAAWAAANPERKRAANAAWRRDNLQRMRETRAAWKAANADRLKVHKQTRRARAAESGGVLSHDITARLFTLQRGRCASCGCELSAKHHIDHIVPLAKGGRNDDENVQLLCPPCNWSKNDMDPIEWARKHGRLL